MVKHDPWPGLEVTETTPPNCRTSLITTFMPTPRPEIWVILLVVVKPALKIYCITSRSDKVSSFTSIKPCAIAFSRTAATLMPRPSSLKLITTSLPSRSTSKVICPLRSLPEFRRICGLSIPWSTALRSMCSSGEVMRSRMVRSISSSALIIVSSTDLFSSLAVWRTIRSKRGVKRANGTIREFISPSCSSVWVRDNCKSRFSLSRVFSSKVLLMSIKSEADSDNDFDNWFRDEYWSISSGSKPSLAIKSASSICDKICCSSSLSIRRNWSAKRCTVVPISSILRVKLLIPISIRARLMADSPDRLIIRSIRLPEIRIISLLLLTWSSSVKLPVIGGISAILSTPRINSRLVFAAKIAPSWACNDSTGTDFRLSGFLLNCCKALTKARGLGGLTWFFSTNTASASQSWHAVNSCEIILVAGRRRTASSS